LSDLCLLGALAGDVIGSVYEFAHFKSMDFPLFSPGSCATDDSFLALAVADAILKQGSYQDSILAYARKYPSNYGGNFRAWINSDSPRPYNSLGNGSAMRVSPIGWAFDTEAEVLLEAEKGAVITHSHPEGIKGAQAVALAIFRARHGASKAAIRLETTQRFGYDLSGTIDEIRPGYEYSETCPETVPPAMIAFLDSVDFEDALRKAISLGGDADTLAAITGSIAEAFYGGVPPAIQAELPGRIPAELWEVVLLFNQKYNPRTKPRPGE
jgi:ADP-ribosylglycohydrolase